jgi:hypothetical protein
MYNYQNLPGLNGADNTSGLQVNCHFAPISEFLLIKGFKTTTDPGDSVTIDGSHTFAAGKGFTKAYGTLGTGQLTSESNGEVDGRGATNKGVFFHPGNKKEVAEFIRKGKNDDFIFLFHDADGTINQVGSEGIPAKLTGKYDSATLGNGRKGWMIEVEAYAQGLAFYEGTITEKA